jgi:hypothetical protein
MIARFQFAVVTILLTLVCSVWIGGCAAYRVGSETLYRPDVQTVYVPVFASESFRRQLGERLTEAVVKQIELTTPYKVVSSPNADSILQGRIIEESKYAITENVNDELRDIELEMAVEITWRGRNGVVLFGPARYPMTADFELVGQAIHFVPEGGQSLVVGQQELILGLAQQIVAQMEVAW